MSQQINLLNPALIKQKDLLNPNTIGIMLLLMTSVMIAYTAYAQKQLQALTAQSTTIAAELASSQTRLTQMAAARAPREPNKALIAHIAVLEQKEKIQLEVFNTIQQSANSQSKSYAALMAAFARQTVDGLWLTGFSYNSTSQALNLTGRTIEADLVPEYIARLGREPVLQGKQFSGLTMAQPKADATNINTPVPLPLQAAPTTTMTAPNPMATTATGALRMPTTGNLPAKPKPQYLEFSLQSVHSDTLKPNSLNKEMNTPSDAATQQGAPS